MEGLVALLPFALLFLLCPLTMLLFMHRGGGGATPATEAKRRPANVAKVALVR